MGWIHSPFIAQAATWMLVLHRTASQESTRGRGRRLPERIYSLDDGAGATVYRDSIVILSRTPEQQRAGVVRRMKENMNELNAELKLTKRKKAGLPAPQTTKEHQAAERLEWRYTDVRKEEVQILGMVSGDRRLSRTRGNEKAGSAHPSPIP